MLTQQDISKQRGLVGRLLVGGAAIAVLATTATLVPAGIASAQADFAAPPAPPAPPEAPDAPLPPEPPEAPMAPEAIEDVHRVVIVTDDDGEGTSADGRKREVHRIVVREAEGDAKGRAMFVTSDGSAPHARRVEVRMPGSLSREDILATLKEQGVTGKQAEAIADKLEAKGKKQFAFAPMPPMPAMPPMPPMPTGNWQSFDGKGFSTINCSKGQQAMPLVNRNDGEGGKHSRVMMFRCGDPADKGAQLSALKKAREQFAKGESGKRLSDDIRAKVAADLDRAIADLEKSDH